MFVNEVLESISRLSSLVLIFKTNKFYREHLKLQETLNQSCLEYHFISTEAVCMVYKKYKLLDQCLSDRTLSTYSIYVGFLYLYYLYISVYLVVFL